MVSLNNARTRIWLTAVCFAASSLAEVSAQGDQAAVARSAGDTHRSTEVFLRPSTAEISTPATLRAYLRTKDEVHGSRYAQRTNRFCFVKQPPRNDVEGDTASLWMIWHEGGEILDSAGSIGPGDDAALRGRSEALAKSVHLATDVVESKEQIAGSTFLIDRAWVDSIINACKTKGRTVSIAPLRRTRH
ncbi:hypothetical protein ACIGHN_09620 [Acidovorax sp. NPDC077693]|jgi:hypothetical protein|uniref:hypothetical protein n=1 Tax=unclassified Acidovorax TaxID=2684926 RepID=UPI0037C83F73